MIRYTPPKSQVWGHQVGRLSALSVVERALQFLDEQCIIIKSQPAELMLTWVTAARPLVLEALAEIDLALGQPRTMIDIPGAGDETHTLRRWPFQPESLRTVAEWVDKLASARTPDMMAQTSMFWMIAWRDEQPPLLPMQSAGGMFGVHLGKPHRITTMFLFRNLDQYSRIKEYLKTIGLTELSDKHLRPRIVTDPAKQRTK